MRASIFPVIDTGKRLLDYYSQADRLGGLKAKMRLAMITKISSSMAEGAPDSPDNIGSFEKAIAELKKEFN